MDSRFALRRIQTDVDRWRDVRRRWTWAGCGEVARTLAVEVFPVEDARRRESWGSGSARW